MILATDERPPITTSSTDPDIEILEERGWLRLDHCFPPAFNAASHRWLALNLGLPGTAGFAMAKDGSMHLRVDLPLDTDEPVEDRFESALKILHRAMRIFDGSGEAMPSEAPSEQPPVPAICEASGFKCIERGAGHWMVEMQGTPSYCQAEISVEGAEVIVSVAPPEWEQDVVAPVCFDAITHLLLLGTGSIRMIRAATLPESNRHVLAARTSCEEAGMYLPHALCALSVAARALLREVPALRDPRIAEHYLATLTLTPFCEEGNRP